MNLDLAAMALEQMAAQSGGRDFRMDEGAFRRLYEETAQPLFAYLIRVSGQRDLAEDLLQEAYCRFLTARVPAMDEASRKSYLFRIATNLLRDHWRRNKEHPLPDDIGETHFLNTPSDQQIGIRQAFRHLKNRERSLLWLAYVEGLSHKEIADWTGLKAGSIRLLLFRARRRLLSLIHQGPGCGPKADV